ncbi:hypothetical protein DFH09DRAFT_1331075 [Mycena vulgaris]|nr:hypothetical protein DFH09DRAFT_1331075 [Mycena vulgaris]
MSPPATPPPNGQTPNSPRDAFSSKLDDDTRSTPRATRIARSREQHLLCMTKHALHALCPTPARLPSGPAQHQARGRHKGRAAPVPPPFDNTAPSFLALSSDSIRTSLNILRDSADVFPPLKSAVGGVLAVWDLADRVSTSDENARALAWRAVGILDAIYNAVGGADSASISPGMLQEILKFEQLLREISAAMEGQLKAGRFRRVLHLRRHESQLAGFTSRLDASSEAFKIGSSTRVELVVNRVELRVDEIQADTSATAALAVVFEKSIIRLHGEVQFLRTVVLFGLSPVSQGYSESECACAI